ncbi:MAG: hypothetical protein ACKO6H_08130 [Betaproteobacteria bacterium]
MNTKFTPTRIPIDAADALHMAEGRLSRQVLNTHGLEVRLW